MITKQIDPKYSIKIDMGGEVGLPAKVEIVNMTGDPIPGDEPLILFRARDYLALPMLEHYAKLALADGCTDFHMQGIQNRIDAFKTFKEEHPERMKQPGVTKGM